MTDTTQALDVVANGGLDWRKAAGTVQKQTAERLAVEKAFMDQAFNSVANKAGPLMEAPHAIGFEIMKTNREHTHMAGVFGFRIGDDFLQVPVFFENGHIRGGDLLYRHSTKTIVPLDEDWVAKLIEEDTQPQGRGLEKDQRRFTAPKMDIQRLAYPPGSGPGSSGVKFACVGREEDMSSEGWDTAVDGLVEHITNTDFNELLGESGVKTGSLLKELILDIGMPAWDSITKTAMANHGMLQGLHRHIDESCWMPEELIAQARGYDAQVIEKQAATQADAESTAELLLVCGGDPLVTTKMASAEAKQVATEIYARGWAIVDRRPTEKVASVAVNEKPINEGYQTVEGPGIWSILAADGGKLKCLTGAKAYGFDSSIGAGCNPGSPWSQSEDKKSLIFYNLDEAGKFEANTTDVCVMDSFYRKQEKGEDTGDGCGSLSTLLKEECKMLKEFPDTGVHVLVDTANGEIYGPFKVLGVSKSGDGDCRRVTLRGSYKSDTQHEILCNPHSKVTDPKMDVAGRAARWVKIPTKKSESEYEEWTIPYISPGNYMSMLETLTKTGAADHLEVMNDGSDIKMRCNNVWAELSPFDTSFDRLQAEVWLTKHAAFSINDARGILDQAESARRVDVIRILPEEKQASLNASRMINEPVFRTEKDPAFGVDTESPQVQILQALSDKNEPPKSRYLEFEDPSMGAGPAKTSDDSYGGVEMETIMGSDPGQLSDIAKQLNKPRVFEHGVLGHLLDTYDSVSEIDKYIPKLESHVDALGRMLYMIYWKPGDFRNAFGSDDLSNLENHIKSVFENTGKLVIKLHRKSIKKTQG